jgi:DHA1 family tetracycline resistance protein-like MFS transporter
MHSLMSQRVDETAQGKLQGAINSIRGITGMAGPPIFGNILAYVTSPDASWHFIGAPYYLAAILLSCALLVAIYVTRAHAFIRSAAPAAPASPETPSH